MIKIFIITTLLLLSNSASAAYNLSHLYGANKLYLKGIIGGSKLLSIKEKEKSIGYKTKHDSILSPSVGVGIGYNLTPLSRIELVTQMHLPYFEPASTTLLSVTDSVLTGSSTTNRKANIQTLTANYYFTVLDKPDYDIFIGGGIGIARIKEKTNYMLVGNTLAAGELRSVQRPCNSSTKMINNFTYVLSIGTSIKLQQNVDFELVYNWRDFGKNKPVRNELYIPAKKRYHGHDYTAGLRFAI